MNPVVTDLASLLALLGNSWWGLMMWARLVGSRAWPQAEGAEAVRLRLGLAGLVLVQAGAALSVHGLLAGAFVLACAWMTAGFVFVMGWNAAPRWNRRAGSAVGLPGTLACLLLIGQGLPGRL